MAIQNSAYNESQKFYYQMTNNQEVCLKLGDKVYGGSVKIADEKYKVPMSRIEQSDLLARAKQENIKISKLAKHILPVVEEESPKVFSIKMMLSDKNNPIILESVFSPPNSLVNHLNKQIQDLEKEIGELLVYSKLCADSIRFGEDPKSFEECVSNFMSNKDPTLLLMQNSVLETQCLIHSYLKKYQSGTYPIYVNLLDVKNNEFTSNNPVLEMLELQPDDIETLKANHTIWFIQIDRYFLDHLGKIFPFFQMNHFSEWTKAKFVFILSSNLEILYAGDEMRYFAFQRQPVCGFRENKQPLSTALLQKLLEEKNLSHFERNEVQQMLNNIGMPLTNFLDYNQALDAIPTLAPYKDIKSEMSLIEQWIFAMSQKLNDQSKETIFRYVDFIHFLGRFVKLYTLGKPYEIALSETLNSTDNKGKPIVQNSFEFLIDKKNSEFRKVLKVELSPTINFKFPFLLHFLESSIEPITMKKYKKWKAGL